MDVEMEFKSFLYQFRNSNNEKREAPMLCGWTILLQDVYYPLLYCHETCSQKLVPGFSKLSFHNKEAFASILVMPYYEVSL
jgi:hypothetical protein